MTMRGMTKRWLVGGATLLAAVASVGCGGGGGSAPAPTTTISAEPSAENAPPVLPFNGSEESRYAAPSGQISFQPATLTDEGNTSAVEEPSRYQATGEGVRVPESQP